MLYADSYYKYKAEKGLTTILLPQINWFDKLLWKITGYQITELPIDPEEENVNESTAN